MFLKCSRKAALLVKMVFGEVPKLPKRITKCMPAFGYRLMLSSRVCTE